MSWVAWRGQSGAHGQRLSGEQLPVPVLWRSLFREPPGSCDICPICFWEDDNVQLRWPDWAGGANTPALIESQRVLPR